MMFTVEAFKKAKGDDEARWHVEGERETYDEALALFDSTCTKRAGAVILRGEMGELIVKRSVDPT